MKTPDPIEIKFGTVDYVGEGTRHAKFLCKFLQGGLFGKWVKYTQIFFFYMPFFRSPTGQTF